MRAYNDIPLWKNVTQAEWDDWKWQLRNRITTVEQLKQVVNLTPEEEAGCDYRYTRADCLVLTSLALGVKALPKNDEESFKVILPPSRWPFGGPA